MKHNKPSKKQSKSASPKKTEKRNGPTPEELDQMSALNKRINDWLNTCAVPKLGW